MTTVITRGAGSAQALGYAARATAANYIEDVFSTYLYSGNSALQGIGNGIELGPDTGNSTYFNGGQINTNSSTSAFSLGTDAWTVECWIKSTYTSRIDPYELNGGTDASSGFFGLTINASSSGDIQWNEAVGSSASAVISATGTAIVNGSWHHVAITRSGNSVRMFLDGTQIGSTYTTSYTYGSANKAFRFGNRYPGGISSGSDFYISNFRIVKGTALYTSSFTPPSASLTQISGTSYLAHQSISSNTDTTGIGNGYVNAATPSGLGPFNYGTGKGGLVWLKARNTAFDHQLYDTARGAGKVLYSNLTSAQSTVGTGLTAFSATGFTLGGGNVNTSTVTYTSWTFRKQAKFFDVVTYTGDGVAGRTVSHSLGAVPGCIIVKRLDGATADWQVYHRSIGATKYILLNSTAAESTVGASSRWNSTAPTSTNFTLGDGVMVNNNGTTYVAYLFAHDAGGFGASGSDNVITCGTFTANASGYVNVNLGYEPQFVLTKCTSTTDNWTIYDDMRGMPASTTTTNTGNTTAQLKPNVSNAEDTGTTQIVNVTNTGFAYHAGGYGSQTFIYIAIRRGPMRTPTSGTSVFTPVTYTGNDNADRQISTTISPDLSIVKARNNTTVNLWVDRLRGSQYLISSSASLEGTVTGLSGGGQIVDTSAQAGIKILLGTSTVNNVNQSGINYVDWNFKRAPGFFDEVCYTGTGSARTVTHNLGTTPELMIVKARSVSEGWRVYHSNPGATKRALLYTDDAFAVDSTTWNNTAPTASVFTVGTDNSTNQSGQTFVAYLFGSVTGVSKVGSYTGNGTTNQINCGFTGGSRFVMIKRADGLGEWYIWDSARGIVAANDPYLWWNSNSAEVTSTDYIDTYSAGFEISSTAPAAINANGGTFIFLAIA